MTYHNDTRYGNRAYDVWTKPKIFFLKAIALARRLAAKGIDRITTNDAPHLARALNNTVEF